MQWLLTLETEQDAITLCRLMNVFRRKGLKLATLAVVGVPAGYAVAALVETAESEVEHIFNFLRRTEGVRHVTSYRHAPTPEASFVFVDAEENAMTLGRLLEAFPESKVIFASHGKYLLEVSIGAGAAKLGLEGPQYLPLAAAFTTRQTRSSEMRGAAM